MRVGEDERASGPRIGAGLMFAVSCEPFFLLVLPSCAIISATRLETRQTTVTAVVRGTTFSKQVLKLFGFACNALMAFH